MKIPISQHSSTWVWFSRAITLCKSVTSFGPIAVWPMWPVWAADWWAWCYIWQGPCYLSAWSAILPSQQVLNSRLATKPFTTGSVLHTANLSLDSKCHTLTHTQSLLVCTIRWPLTRVTPLLLSSQACSLGCEARWVSGYGWPGQGGHPRVTRSNSLQSANTNNI